jgi:nicotinate-nucleotide adenylyltransferase
MSRIGIYAGTFDPVHAGHIAFALQSIEAAKLDKVYFLPERRPRAKQQVEHFGHRVAMLKRAFKPHPQLHALELVDVNFSVTRTLPKLKEMFAGDQLVFLFGSDVVPSISDWPNASSLLKDNEFVVGLRHDDKREDIHKVVESWTTQPQLVTVFESYAPDVSSGKIREALRLREKAKGTLTSVERYSDHNWLYVSLA